MRLWGWRKPILINNTANSNTLTDYQVLVNLDATDLLSSNKVAKDYRDVRFTDSDGNTLLNYWIEIPLAFNGTIQRINTTANIKSVTYLLNTTGTTGVGNLTFTLKNDTANAAGHYIYLTVNNVLITTITIPSSPTSYTYSFTNLIDTNNITFWTSDTVDSASITSVSINYYNKTQRIWVKVPFIPASTTKTIYVYYGNPSATSTSNGTATFDFFDDFNDNSIDTSKWIETDPNNRVTEQNQRLELANPHTADIPVFTDQLKSTVSISSGIAVLENYLTWVTDSTEEAWGGAFLWFDNNNYAVIMSRTSSGGNLRLKIVAGGSTYYDVDTTISKGKKVKIEYDFSATTVKFFYFDGSSWVQMGTTQTVNLGTNAYVVLSAYDRTVFTGANPIIIDDLIFRKIISPEPTTSVGNEENSCGPYSSTQFLVNVTGFSPTIGTTFYVYYGNPAVTSISQPISAFGYGTTLLPEETWIRISGGSGSLLITGGGGNLTIK
jgi:hypothetical protein